VNMFLHVCTFILNVSMQTMTTCVHLLCCPASAMCPSCIETVTTLDHAKTLQNMTVS